MAGTYPIDFHLKPVTQNENEIYFPGCGKIISPP